MISTIIILYVYNGAPILFPFAATPWFKLHACSIGHFQNLHNLNIVLNMRGPEHTGPQGLACPKTMVNFEEPCLRSKT